MPDFYDFLYVIVHLFATGLFFVLWLEERRRRTFWMREHHNIVVLYKKCEETSHKRFLALCEKQDVDEEPADAADELVEV